MIDEAQKKFLIWQHAMQLTLQRYKPEAALAVARKLAALALEDGDLNTEVIGAESNLLAGDILEESGAAAKPSGSRNQK
jgi:hypothetical protein